MVGKNYVDGNWCSASAKLESRSPENGQILGIAADSSNAEVDGAVKAARQAFAVWHSTELDERAEILARAADLLRREYGKEGEVTPLKKLIREEMGKRSPEADIEVMESADMLAFFAEHGPDSLSDRHIALNRDLWPTKKSILRFEPIGVVGVIKPWNYPLELPIWSIGAALMAGNTIVFKPSEHTPLVAIRLTELLEESGVPPGVFNLVTGGPRAGAALATHPDVDMISFTGSSRVGKDIAVGCASRFQRVSLELGGKDAMIVLPDANIPLTVNGAVWGAFTNCGQVCVGVRRLLLHSSIKRNFLELLLNSAQSLRIGKDIGPLVSEEQRSKVEHHVVDAVAKGAQVLCGGRRPTEDQFSGGYYFEPTVLENTAPEMLVETEDTFGPVVTVHEFETLEEAIQLANSVPYDLGASLWTQDTSAGLQIARELQTGMVWINDVNVAFPQAPWTGRRWSGHGLELSEFSFYEYAVRKHVNLDNGDEVRRPWWFPYA